MSIPTPSQRRLHAAMLQQLAPSEPTLNCVAVLLAEARHWCDRHGERFESVSHIARELYEGDLAATKGRRS